MFLLLALIVIASTNAHPSPRVWGGKNATTGQFPYLVSLNDASNTQQCDGAILNRRWIVTAAHCVATMSTDYTVLAGTVDQNAGGVRLSIAKLIPHPDYDEASFKNDIGLIQLDQEIQFDDSIQALEMTDVAANTTCQAVGWGGDEHTSFPEIALYVDVEALDLEACQGFLDEHPTDGVYLGPEQVCGWAEKGKGVCFGDSGGPLVCGGKVAGLVSWAMWPCAQGFPDVYTRLATYADWLEEVTAA